MYFSVQHKYCVQHMPYSMYVYSFFVNMYTLQKLQSDNAIACVVRISRSCFQIIMKG